MAQNPLDDRTDDFETYHIAFLTQKIGFRSPDAQKFWPIYNEMRADLRQLRKDRFRLRREMMQANNQKDDQALSKTMRSYVALRKREAEIHARFHAKLEAALPIETVFDYYRAEERWKVELLKKLKERK